MDSIPFFYESQILSAGLHLVLSENTSHHCIHVLRMKKGAQLHLTDGRGGLFLATIVEENRKHCEVSIESAVDNQFSDRFGVKKERKVSIAISLVKNVSRFEWFLEKATELGVRQIIPLRCKHTESHVFKRDRWQNILISSMLQSCQTFLPELTDPQPFTHVVENSQSACRLIAHCEQDRKSPLADLSLEQFETIQILIGPEGDFTSEEIDLALTKGFIPVSLGGTRLRTETAGVTASVMLNCR